jgi:hypothetical protein
MAERNPIEVVVERILKEAMSNYEDEVILEGPGMKKNQGLRDHIVAVYMPGIMGLFPKKKKPFLIRVWEWLLRP